MEETTPLNFTIHLLYLDLNPLHLIGAKEKIYPGIPPPLHDKES